MECYSIRLPTYIRSATLSSLAQFDDEISRRTVGNPTGPKFAIAAEVSSNDVSSTHRDPPTGNNWKIVLHVAADDRQIRYLLHFAGFEALAQRCSRHLCTIHQGIVETYGPFATGKYDTRTTIIQK